MKREDIELHARANLYSDAIVESLLKRFPFAIASARHSPEFCHALRREVATAFVVAFAAGVESASMPRRTVRK